MLNGWMSVDMLVTALSQHVCLIHICKLDYGRPATLYLTKQLQERDLYNMTYM